MEVKSLKKYRPIILILLTLAVPVTIYLYFLPWKTFVIYADDVSIFESLKSLPTFYEKINMPVSFGKYRPIQGIVVFFLTESFQKDLNAYYTFNVGVQALITFAFALSVNLILKSPIQSIFISLSVGLSRFSLWNISQLLNGGALEGLAMFFFLLSLFFTLQTLIKKELNLVQERNRIISSLIFAALAFYTHERYIVIVPFIILLVLFFPSLSILSKSNKALLVAFALALIVINVFVKKYVYSIPFFLGTGGSNISFSLSTTVELFTQGILSILQINSGPEHLSGMPFSSLSAVGKMLPIIVCANFLVIIFFYIFKTKQVLNIRHSKNYIMLYIKTKSFDRSNNALIVFSLILLFMFLLIPAVATIRLEHRWLQAPFSVFVLIIITIWKDLTFSSNPIARFLLPVLIIISMYVDYSYLSNGADKTYFMMAQRDASKFKQAVDKGIIYPDTSNLYIWEKKKDINIENGLRWTLINGDFFDINQTKSKNLVFVDSNDMNNKIDKNSDQVIYIEKDQIIDITDQYIQNSIPESFIESK